LNGLYPLFNSTEEFLNDGGLKSKDHEFDFLTMREYSTVETVDDSGQKKSIKCNDRYYMPSEITWLLETLNFRDIGIFGCKLGRFSRDDKLTTKDFEMLVIAEKK
ncbi:MAG: class I SAM-dependent methyltransferase, partial [bacterium]|nr:class I SAM-dependent methyltransferase [bacterium]